METGKANSIQASTFNIDHADQYRLQIQIGLDHFSYCVINNTTNSVEYFKNFVINDTIIEIINKEKVLKLQFSSSLVSFTNFPCNVIPNEFSKSENLKDILELNTDVYDIIKSDHLTKIDAQLIYTIPSVINDIVFTFFPNAKQKAQQTILIEQFSNYDNKEDNAYLYISDNILNITIFRNEKFLFNNSFHFKSQEDILYFTLFTFEQLKLDTETVNTKLYGEITKNDNNYQLLYKYIRNIQFGTKPNHLNFPSEFNEIEIHQFHTLFSQSI